LFDEEHTGAEIQESLLQNKDDNNLLAIDVEDEKGEEQQQQQQHQDDQFEVANVFLELGDGGPDEDDMPLLHEEESVVDNEEEMMK
jgi:hypothetical protein